MKNVKNKLRVVHIPQVPMDGFIVEVQNEREAYLIEQTLANQHLWLYENNVIDDYSNVICIEMYDKSIDEETGEPYGWSDYYNEEEMMEFDEFVEAYLTK